MENLSSELKVLDEQSLKEINGGHEGESYSFGQSVGRGVKYGFSLIGMVMAFV